MLCVGALFITHTSRAQWVVTDPANLAQGIINATKNIVQTSTTATNMVKNFQETVKIYQQGKEFYDGLKKVKNLVKDARKVQQTILMVGDITDIYVTNFERMLSDPYFSAEELSAIASGYTILLEESANVLNDLRTIVNENGLSMSEWRSSTSATTGFTATGDSCSTTRTRISACPTCVLKRRATRTVSLPCTAVRPNAIGNHSKS